MEETTLNTVRLLEFSWIDYSLFTVMLLLSALIGIYFGCFEKKQTSAKEYLMGGKQMKPIPIATSLVASTISGIALLAIPTDVYRFGATYWFSAIAVIAPCLVTAYVYLPVFYQLQCTSTNEYLKLRFDSRLQKVASFLFTLSIFLYLPIVIYVPAMALSQVCGANMSFVTPLICAICIFYTTLGGLKAVVWTDLLQFTATVGAIAVVFCIGVVEVGGIGEVFQRASDGQLFDFDFDPTPTKRDTVWAMMLGWAVNSLSHTAIVQTCVQKFLSVPTFEDAKRTVFYYIFGMIVVKTCCCMIGLIMFAKYFLCDPLSLGVVQKPDQMLPYYVLDVAGKIPGLPGLFIAGVFCASLSTLSAVMNCVAGTIYEDFLATFMPKDISQESVSYILKVIVVIVGITSTCLVFIVEHLEGLLPLVISAGAVNSGPLLGLFTLGMLFPKANAKGALYGTLASLVFVLWVVIGAQYYKSQHLITFTPKIHSTIGCGFNVTSDRNNTVSETTEEVFALYRISHYYYTFFGALVGIIVGNIVSWITNEENAVPVDKKLISPVIHFLLVKDDSKGIYKTIGKEMQIIVTSEKYNDKKYCIVSFCQFTKAFSDDSSFLY